jgi:hypothetical protein
MARPLRFVPEKSLVEVTTRTFQGRLPLRPSPELTDIILGIVGKAQALYGMTIHAFVFMSTHAHFLLSPASGGQLVRFMQFVNANVAKEAGGYTLGATDCGRVGIDRSSSQTTVLRTPVSATYSPTAQKRDCLPRLLFGRARTVSLP